MASSFLKRVARWLRRVRYFGRSRWCPTCRSRTRTFVAHGEQNRPDVKCPVCRSVERDRLTSIVLASRPDLRQVFDDGGALLHVAPEPALASWFRRQPRIDYVTGDLEAPDVSVRLDVQALPFADESFDAVYCSHVLEHVQDDRCAMRELHRVLKGDGWAILLVPISADSTVEDPDCTDPEERRQRFGQTDHVRAYGPDYVERLKESGFEVETLQADAVIPPRERESMRIRDSQKLFVCRRRSQPAG